MNELRKIACSALFVWCFLLVNQAVRACPVPVYQYALEHWKSDPYIVTVRHGAVLDEDQQKAVDFLRSFEKDGQFTANIVLKTEEAQDETGPVIELYYPAVSRIRRPVWTGPLSLENAEAIIESPVRKQLGEALLRRTSAVWIFLESGDRRADRETATLLEKRLSALEKTIVVPDAAAWGGETVEIDSNVNFKVLRLSRDDPAERIFLSMLLASEPDLEDEFAGVPMVFPIYGRGLILYALVGKGINNLTIGMAAEFLTAPCSCQIKAANPGTDILMAVDWENKVTPMTPASVGGTVGTGSFLQRLDEAEKKQEVENDD